MRPVPTMSQMTLSAGPFRHAHRISQMPCMLLSGLWRWVSTQVSMLAGQPGWTCGGPRGFTPSGPEPSHRRTFGLARL
eukprot:15470435-Alexandrium_andersonii.AAC.1